MEADGEAGLTLKRYLLIVFILTFSGLLILGAVMNGRQGLVGMLVLAPFIALANTFINFWPWARMVPVERRTSCRAYRWTNVFMALWLATVVVIAFLKVGTMLTS